MNIKKYIFAVLVFVAVLMISNISKAGSLEFNNLTIDATLKENGDMVVTEFWNINIRDTNTLFKDWKLDYEKYSGIEDVSVVEVFEDGSQKKFTEIGEEMYHVTKDCFYAFPISEDTYEIAWGVHVDNAVKEYRITYTVKNVVNHYDDCYELYWQFVGPDNAIPINELTGVITLENAVYDIEDLRTWAHGPLTGEVKILSNDTIQFNAERINPNTYIEARVAIAELDVFSGIAVTDPDKTLQDIIDEETIWADEANRLREQNTLIINRTVYGFIAISILLTVFAIFKLKKARKIREENVVNKIKATQEYEYFRDIPDETASAAEALFLYKYGSVSNQTRNNGKILSATMLNLCLKNRLEFEVDQAKKKNNITFIIKGENTKNAKELTTDEKLILDLLEEAADYKKDDEEKETDIKKLTVKELEKYAKKNAEHFIKTFENVDTKVRENAREKGKYDPKIVEKSLKWSTWSILYAVLGVFGLVFFVIPGIVMFIIASTYHKLYKEMDTLTQKGEDEKQEWKGLKKYMEEFSLLKDKEVPHLVLWEKYLVYATVFGIAEKVIKQLKIVYPQISEIDDFTYMNLIYNTAFATSFIDTLDNSITNVYNDVSASYYNSTASSGDGFGGGFSRRWRLRRRWRRLWWQIKTSPHSTFIFDFK